MLSDDVLFFGSEQVLSKVDVIDLEIIYGQWGIVAENTDDHRNVVIRIAINHKATAKLIQRIHRFHVWMDTKRRNVIDANRHLFLRVRSPLSFFK
jgi:hypothetical protein